MKTMRILSLGAGVQSTTLALMVHRGNLPPIVRAIFADTQEEPGAVYRHLEWLMKETGGSFKTDVVTAGKLGDDLMRSVATHPQRFASVPFFTRDPVNWQIGQTRRQCSADYKVAPIERHIRRDIIGLKHGQRFPKDIRVTQLIGMSADEPRRVLKVRAQFASKTPWATPEFPLFAMGMDRKACAAWLVDYGIPHQVPKSACVFCPYTDDNRWREIKATDPEGWARAVEVDDAIRRPGALVRRGMDGDQFVHRRCEPLSQIDFSISNQEARKRAAGELAFQFSDECEGVCGV